MEMIREGVNPLELNVEQLNSKAQEIKNRMADVSEEKFSKYLWKLEQNQQITPEERDSYIGIYRLLNQIDKTDGAVIGALVQQGADLTMKNLLSAVRTNRNPFPGSCKLPHLLLIIGTLCLFIQRSFPQLP